ncbi:MAG: O-antigen ligase family protein [Streptosporangiaceae bacterium]
MSVSVPTLRRIWPGQPLLSPEATHERRLQHRVGAAIGLLFLNALGYSGALIHIPSVVGKLITQGALPAALLILLTVNRRVLIRPSVFLCLVSLLPLEAILTALQPQYLGTVYRTFRLMEFVLAMWLLTPWWGRRDMLLLRAYMWTLSIILGSVLVGLVLSPGNALPYGRLSGALWDIPSTQVAHYAAVTIGLLVVLWLSGNFPGRITLIVSVVAGGMLLLTHTRTALIGMVAGILVAGLSLIVAKSRVRKAFATAGAVLAIAIMTLSSVITTWLARGEGTQELTNLTGRTKVWGPLLALPRDKFQEIFGFGLSNSSFDGLPIDSNWLSSYDEQGLFGVGVCIAILIFLLVAAYFAPQGLHRALALFLITYCLVASFTEDGFTDATPYLIELSLAASLLVPPIMATRRRSSRTPGQSGDLDEPAQLPAATS